VIDFPGSYRETELHLHDRVWRWPGEWREGWLDRKTYEAGRCERAWRAIKARVGSDGFVDRRLHGDGEARRVFRDYLDRKAILGPDPARAGAMALLVAVEMGAGQISGRFAEAFLLKRTLLRSVANRSRQRPGRRLTGKQLSQAAPATVAGPIGPAISPSQGMSMNAVQHLATPTASASRPCSPVTRTVDPVRTRRHEVLQLARQTGPGPFPDALHLGIVAAGRRTESAPQRGASAARSSGCPLTQTASDGWTRRQPALMEVRRHEALRCPHFHPAAPRWCAAGLADNCATAAVGERQPCLGHVFLFRPQR